MKSAFLFSKKIFLLTIPVLTYSALHHFAYADTRTQSIWCSISDPAGERIFVSNPIRRPIPSRIAIMDYGSRFARTVNSRFGLHVVLEGNHCHAFPSSYRAATTYAALVSRMADQNFKIISVSIF